MTDCFVLDKESDRVKSEHESQPKLCFDSDWAPEGSQKNRQFKIMSI